VRKLALLLVLAALAWPSGATAGTRLLRWRETLHAGPRVVLVFRFGRVTFTRAGWTVTASVRNTSRSTLALARVRFALFVYRRAYANPSTRHGTIAATAVGPAFPGTLAPGQAWAGQFSGPGRPRRGRWIRFRVGDFAPFESARRAGWGWISDHTFRA
jgi:hypothetical protein